MPSNLPYICLNVCMRFILLNNKKDVTPLFHVFEQICHMNLTSVLNFPPQGLCSTPFLLCSLPCWCLGSIGGARHRKLTNSRQSKPPALHPAMMRPFHPGQVKLSMHVQSVCSFQMHLFQLAHSFGIHETHAIAPRPLALLWQPLLH